MLFVNWGEFEFDVLLVYITSIYYILIQICTFRALSDNCLYTRKPRSHRDNLHPLVRGYIAMGKTDWCCYNRPNSTHRCGMLI